MQPADGPSPGYRGRVESRATIWVRERLATAPAIYGLIVYVVLVNAESDEPHEPPLLILTWSIIAFLAFYIAHVFAEVVARHGAEGLRGAVRKGFGHSAGMLYSAILPTIALLVCVIVGTDGEDAAGWTLLVATIVLAVLGFLATAQRRRGFWARILGAFLTALIGSVVMLIEYAVH